MLEASLARTTRLREEAVAYRQLATAAAASGDVARASSANALASRREAQVARLEGTLAPAALLAQQQARRARALEGAASVGRGITRNVTVPSLLLGGGAVKLNLDYAASLQRIVGLSGVAQAQVNKFNGEVLKLAPAVGKSPGELARALYFITSSGVPASKAMEVLTQSARASAAGLGETEVVADAVTSVLNAYGVKNITAAQATDTLVATVREGKGEAADFAGVIGNVTALSSQLGVSFNDVGAALAAQTQLGTDAETSATQLQRVFTTLLKVTPASEKAFESVGLSAAGLRKELKEKGLLEFLQTIKEKFGDNIPLLAKAFGDQRAIRGVLALVGNNADKVAGVFERLRQSGGSTDTAFAAISQSDLQKFHQATAGIQADLIKLGAALSPVAIRAARVVSAIADGFAKLPGPIKQGLGVAVGFLAVGGPLVLGATKVVAMIGKIRSALLLLPGAAIAGETGTVGALGGIEAGAAGADAAVLSLRASLISLGGLAGVLGGVGVAAFLLEKTITTPQPKKIAPSPSSGPLHQADIVTSGDQLYIQTPGGRLTRYGATGSQATSVLPSGADRHGPAASRFDAAAAKAAARAAAAGGNGPLEQFALPASLQREAAASLSGAGDLAVARKELAYVQKLLDSGRLTGKGLIDALHERRQLFDQLANADDAAKAKHKAAVEKQREALRKAREFHLPAIFGVEQARADALAALTGQDGPTKAQLAIAKRAKAEALKAINSHKLSLEGLQQAWETVGSANQTIAQKLNSGATPASYTGVSSRVLTEGLGLARSTEVLLRQRYAQAAAHSGFAPSSGAVQGIAIDTVYVTGVRNVDQLASEIQKRSRQRNQRRGNR